MRLYSVFRTVLREQLRSPWDLLLVLAIVPMFLWMYWAFVGGGSTFYTVAVLNQDQGSLAAQAIDQLRQVKYPNGSLLLKVVEVDDRSRAEKMLRDRAATALVIFTTRFSETLGNAAASGVTPASALGLSDPDDADIILVGDLRNSYYSPVAIMINASLDGFLRSVVGQPYPLRFAEVALGGSAERTEFETYVPGLLIAAGTMMLFSVAIGIARQIESGAVRRLQITRMTALDFLGGISLLYVLISLGTTLVAFVTAQALGFRSVGPLWVAVLICTITGISVVGVGFITACFSWTTARAAIIVNFPLLLLLFFSGAIFPLGNPRLFTIAGHNIGVFDFLPQTQATLALNKVLSLGAGLGDVAFELIVLTSLSVIYFALGVWLFQRMHLRAG